VAVRRRYSTNEKEADKLPDWTPNWLSSALVVLLLAIAVFFFHSQTTAQAHQMSDLEKALLALMKELEEEHSKTEDSLRQTQDNLRQTQDKIEQSIRRTQEALGKLSRHLGTKRGTNFLSCTSGECVQRRAKRDAIQRGGPEYCETGSCAGEFGY